MVEWFSALFVYRKWFWYLGGESQFGSQVGLEKAHCLSRKKTIIFCVGKISLFCIEKAIASWFWVFRYNRSFSVSFCTSCHVSFLQWLRPAWISHDSVKFRVHSWASLAIDVFNEMFPSKLLNSLLRLDFLAWYLVIQCLKGEQVSTYVAKGHGLGFLRICFIGSKWCGWPTSL